MNIRKIKKEVKKLDDKRKIKIALTSLRKIKQWCNIQSPNSKFNMKILTENFYYKGKFI